MHIGFFGFGHLAQVLCEAVLRAKIVSHGQISFVRRDRAKSKENEQKYHVTATSLGNLVKTSDVIVLGMRPTQVEEALREAGDLNGKQVISVVAGKTIPWLQAHLGPRTQILRTMPNLCSAVNEGMTALSYSENSSPEFRSFGHKFFGAVGQIAEIPEKFMDLIVGMSGSGPAFVVRLIEAMARTGEAHGMKYTDALKISAQTFLGAAKLIEKGHLPQDVLTQIAVPGGTTQAGLNVMTQLDMDKHFRAVIEAAAKRSSEL